VHFGPSFIIRPTETFLVVNIPGVAKSIGGNSTAGIGRTCAWSKRT